MSDMEYRIRYQQWKDYGDLEPELRSELEHIANDEKELYERFYQDLTFGTGGLRGIMGVGTNRMNVYTVQRATAGLALYLLENYGKDAMQRGVVIAYDSRENSKRFAVEAALTLNSFGIRAYVFDRLTPTPELSFAVNYRNAVAGIVVTASHNPKEYNGYKVYNEYGCQIVSDAAEAIWEKISIYQELDQLPAIMPYDDACARDLYHEIGDEYHMAYQKAVLQQALLGDAQAKASLKVVYTPLHGTGLLPVKAVLDKDGFTQVHILESQREPDGQFRTLKSPNPEEKEALKLAITCAETIGADVVLGTDPDSDRVGIAGWDGGQYVLFTGNQTGALLVDFIMRKKEITEKSTVIKTIVTSELGAEIAKAHGAMVMDVLTGFKYIGEKMIEFEKTHTNEFVLGYEESYGYLVGTHAKDKDAVVASMLICEMAAELKAQGKTLIQRLAELYNEYGFYREALDSFVLPGADGQEKISAVMENLRAEKTTQIGELVVDEMKDYREGADGLPKANVLKYFFRDGGWMAVRPSGTEPKIKFYYSLRGKSQEDVDIKLASLQNAVEAIMK